MYASEWSNNPNEIKLLEFVTPNFIDFDWFRDHTESENPYSSNFMAKKMAKSKFLLLHAISMKYSDSEIVPIKISYDPI